MSYPAVSVLSRPLLCPLGLPGGCVRCWLGFGSAVLTEGLEGDEEGTVFIHGVPLSQGMGRKKAQGRGVSFGDSGGSKRPLPGPALTDNLGKNHLHFMVPKLRFITLILPGDTTLALHDGKGR